MWYISFHFNACHLSIILTGLLWKKFNSFFCFDHNFTDFRTIILQRIYLHTLKTVRRAQMELKRLYSKLQTYHNSLMKRDNPHLKAHGSHHSHASGGSGSAAAGSGPAGKPPAGAGGLPGRTGTTKRGSTTRPVVLSPDESISAHDTWDEMRLASVTWHFLSHHLL